MLHRSLSLAAACAATAAALLAPAPPAAASAKAHPGSLILTDRQIPVTGKINVSAATKVATKLLRLDTEAQAPIYLMVTATDGSAQGVRLIADTIRGIESPVVAVVTTQVRGAGAALTPFADRVLMYASAGLVFTEVDYEGVAKPKDKDKDQAKAKAKNAPGAEKPAATPDKGEAASAKAPEVKPQAKLLQAVRAAYLDDFWAAVAQRMYWKTPTLKAKLDEGGFALSAAEAVKQKIAYAVVERLTYTTLGETKREFKATTSDKEERTAQPLRAPDAAAGSR